VRPQGGTECSAQHGSCSSYSPRAARNARSRRRPGPHAARPRRGSPSFDRARSRPRDGFYLVPAGDATNPLRRRDLDWEPSARHREEMYAQLAAIRADGCVGEEVRGVVPWSARKKLVQLERFDGRYVVYDPCDGVQPRYFLMDGFVEQLLGPEPDLLVVRRAESAGEGGFTLVVTRPYVGCKEPDATLRLEPLSHPGWFRVRFDDADYGVFSTPEAAAGLDVLVNVCRTGKASEYPFVRER